MTAYNRYLTKAAFLCVAMPFFAAFLPGAAFAGEPQRMVEGQAPVFAGAEAYYYYIAAQILKKDGEIPGAIELYKKAASLDPASALLQTELGSLLLQSGKTEDAKRHFEKAVSMDPKYPEPYPLLAELHAIQGNRDAAAENYLRAIELDPENTKNYLYLSVHYARGKEFDKSVSTLNKLLYLKPDSVMGYYYLAKIETERGGYQKAEEYYLKSISI
ncbi:MAG: tetratricopeptide repeat protein, partial [Deltaproteobacteria bacterium]|nr:tetratricopeptide repeat protein [Deltaproteobacteria bacterium]